MFTRLMRQRHPQSRAARDLPVIEAFHHARLHGAPLLLGKSRQRQRRLLATLAQPRDRWAAWSSTTKRPMPNRSRARVSTRPAR
jgi:hypothetical protein